MKRFLCILGMHNITTQGLPYRINGKIMTREVKVWGEPDWECKAIFYKCKYCDGIMSLYDLQMEFIYP